MTNEIYLVQQRAYYDDPPQVKCGCLNEDEAFKIAARLNDLEQTSNYEVEPIPLNSYNFLLDDNAPLRWSIWFQFDQYYPEEKSTFRASYEGLALTDETCYAARMGPRGEEGPPQRVHVTAPTREAAIELIREDMLNQWIEWWIERTDFIREKHASRFGGG